MIGETLGPYRLESELGTGGMGKVYACSVAGRAPGLEEGQRVALKVVHPHLLETPGFFKRFLREADVGKQIQHDNVVRTYDADALLVDGVHHNFLVMEYVEGQTLRDLLGELDRVPEELCRHIGREVAQGLQAIHDAGVVHRDLKPENVLITEDHTVKVMDLGVARLQEEAVRLSQTGAFVGSLHYAAPEQFTGEADHLDGRADLHGLGLLLYELACGRHPYEDDDFRKVIQRVTSEQPRRVAEINPQLSAFYEEIVHTLLKKDREERFATAGELASVIDAGESSEWWQERAKALRVETKRPLRRVRIPRETALYGRDADLAKLRALYGKAIEGDGQVVLIEGEAGIGKTRLVDEFVGALRQEGEDLNFLFGSYPPGGAATAAGAFSTAYREQFGSAGLTQVLETYLEDTPLLVPAFAALLRGDVAPKDAEPLTKDSLQTVFVHATRALAAEHPTIVLIDDLHFAPEDGRALFAALSLGLPGHRVLLIGTTRPGSLPEEWVAEVERTDHSSRMTLERLFPKDLVGLLKDTLRSERLAEDLAGKIAVKSDGNPFFVFEILRGLREGQFITQGDDGTWVSTQVIDQIAIPSSVMDLIQARIADLTEEEKELLDVASCCGFTFDPTLVAEVMGMRRIPALRTFGRIEKTHRLVRSAGRDFAFDHHQVQEALYAGQPERLREEYHGAIAETLEERDAADKDPSDFDGALCVDLCEHFLQGARGKNALRYLGSALDHLEAGYLNAQAITLADRALAVPELVAGEERVALLLRKAERLNLLGRPDAERAALDEAAELAKRHGGTRLRAHVETSLGGHLSGVSSYEEAQDVLSSAVELARAAGDKGIEATATGKLAEVRMRCGLFEEARRTAERALTLSREIGSLREQANAVLALGSVAFSQSRYDEALQHWERCRAVSRKSTSRLGEAMATANMGNVLHVTGRDEEAREHYERGLAIARDIGARQSEAITTGNLANSVARQGLLDEARSYYERHLALSREIGFRLGEGVALVNLGWLFRRLGSPTEARDALVTTRDLCRDVGARRVEGYALERLGSVAEDQGDSQGAEQSYREALELRRDLDYRSGIAETLLVLGALLGRTERPDEAAMHLSEAQEIAREVGDPNMLVLTVCELALLPGGDAGAAAAALTAHEDRIEFGTKMEARFLLWKVAGDAAHLAEAHRRLMFLRDHAPEEYRDSMIENVPLHRDIVAAWKEHGG